MAEPSNSQPEASAPDAPLRSPVRVALVTPGDAAPAPLLEALAERGVDLERTRSVFDAMALVTRVSSSLRSARTSGNESATAEDASATPVALLLVEPSQIERAEELVAAVQRYAPGVVIWRYDASSAIPLRGYDGPAARTRVGRLESRSDDAHGRSSDGGPVITKRARPVSDAPAHAARGAPGAQDSSQPKLRLTDSMDDADLAAGAASPSGSDDADAPARDFEEALADASRVDESLGTGRQGDDATLTPEELAMLLGDEDADPPSAGSS